LTKQILNIAKYIQLKMIETDVTEELRAFTTSVWVILKQILEKIMDVACKLKLSQNCQAEIINILRRDNNLI